MWVYIVTYLVTGGTIVCFFSKRWPSILVGFAFLLIVPIVAAAVVVKAFSRHEEPTDAERAAKLAWFLANRDRSSYPLEEMVADEIVRSRLQYSWDSTWDRPSFPLDDSGWPLDEHGRKVKLTLLSGPARVEVRTLGADGVAATEDDVVAVAEIGD
ncbi:MAG: hypothetical protein R3F20_09175 [Planctomycetota bacterium]